MSLRQALRAKPFEKHLQQQWAQRLSSHRDLTSLPLQGSNEEIIAHVNALRETGGRTHEFGRMNKVIKEYLLCRLNPIRAQDIMDACTTSRKSERELERYHKKKNNIDAKARKLLANIKYRSKMRQRRQAEKETLKASKKGDNLHVDVSSKSSQPSTSAQPDVSSALLFPHHRWDDVATHSLLADPQLGLFTDTPSHFDCTASQLPKGNPMLILRGYKDILDRYNAMTQDTQSIHPHELNDIIAAQQQSPGHRLDQAGIPHLSSGIPGTDHTANSGSQPDIPQYDMERTPYDPRIENYGFGIENEPFQGFDQAQYYYHLLNLTRGESSYTHTPSNVPMQTSQTLDTLYEPEQHHYGNSRLYNTH